MYKLFKFPIYILFYAFAHILYAESGCKFHVLTDVPQTCGAINDKHSGQSSKSDVGICNIGKFTKSKSSEFSNVFTIV